MAKNKIFEGIKFIQMGGTIDKHYPAGDKNHGYNFEVGPPAFGRILDRVSPDGSSWAEKQMFRKDSLDITDEDRQHVREWLSRNIIRKIIITHGTDTIQKTAQVLSGYAADRTIVLTGAMQPELFRDSDADFNLGMAIAAVQGYPKGVYIALNCEVKRWDEYEPK